jgi:hypothetical protein
MALNVSSNFTIVADAETETGWGNIGSGGGFALEPDYYVQGSNCISRAVSGNNNRKGAAFTGGPYNFTTTYAGQLIYIWVRCSTPGLLNSIVQGGQEVLVGSSSNNYNAYHVYGSDYNKPTEGWECFVIDPVNSVPTSTNGSGLDPANVQYFGAVITTTTQAKGYNIGIDQIAIGGTLTVTGSTDTNDGFREVAAVAFDDARLNRWGIITEKAGTIFVKGRIQIGNGATATTFNSQGENVVFLTDRCLSPSSSSQPFDFNKFIDDAILTSPNHAGYNASNRNKFGLTFAGTNTTVNFGVQSGNGGRSGSSFNVSGFDDPSGENIVAADVRCEDSPVVNLYASTFNNFRSNLNLDAGTGNFFGNTFSVNGELIPGDHVVKNCNFIEAPRAAFHFAQDTVIESCNFISNNVAIHTDATGTISFNDLQFSGNTTDVNADNPVTINLVGSNAGTSTGGPINFVNSVQLKLTGLVDGSEVRVFRGGTQIEIAGDEDVQGGEFITGIDAAQNPTVDIAVIALDYQNIFLSGIEMVGNREIPIQQIFDRQYENDPLLFP